GVHIPDSQRITPAQIRTNGDYTRPPSNREHPPALHIYHRPRTHQRLHRRKRRSRQRRTNPHRTCCTTALHFSTASRNAPATITDSSRTTTPLPTTATQGHRQRSRPHNHNT